jgi:HEAT repeat-containing protein 5
LREFARLRFEPEQSPAGLGGAGSTDQLYQSMSRANILPIYQQSWLQLVDAIACLIENDSRLVFDILDEKDRVAVETDSEEGIQYSNEPAAFFLVLFGLCFEGLLRPQQSLGNNVSLHNGSLRVLVALKRILHPAVSGTMIYQDVVFGETVDVFERLMLTGTCEEQTVVATIVRNLCIHHPGAISQSGGPQSTQNEDGAETISESVEQLFELFRIVMLGLTTALPFLSDTPVFTSQLQLDNRKLSFIKVCLENLVEMISVFPRIIQVDLFACNLYVFSRILEDDSIQKTVVPLCLAPQKRLLEFMIKTRSEAIGYQETIDQEISTAFSHAITLLTSWKRGDSENDIVKIKNCILSCVIIVTTGKTNLNHEESYLADLARILVDCIGIPQLSTMIIECAKTLLVSTVDSPIGKALAVNILPAFISFATSGVESLEDTQEKEIRVNPITKLVNDLLVVFTLKLSGDDLRAGLALTVPCLLHFAIDESVGIPTDARRYYVNQKLLQLAAYSPETFKSVIQGGLSPQQKAIAESVLRGDESEGEEQEDLSDSATHIQLKSFGE